MFDKRWGCDFYECIVDGKLCEGGVANIKKTNWNLIDPKDFKNYYYK